MDVYIVTDLHSRRIIGVSANFHGATLIRHKEARRMAIGQDGHVADEDYRTCYERLHIENHDVQDM